MKKILLIAVVLGLSFYLVSWLTKEYKSREISLKFTADTVDVEYGTQIDYMRFIIWGNFDKVEYKGINTEIIGKNEITYIAFKEEKKREFKLKVNIIDTQYPTFIKETLMIVIEEGTEFNLCEYFEADDPVDGRVEIFLSNPIDIKPGNYSREVIAKDINGNESRTLTTIVIEPKQIAVVSPEPDKPSDSPKNNKKKGDSPGKNDPKIEEPEKPKPVPPLTGVRNFSVVENISWEQFQKKVMSGVKGNYWVDFKNINLSKPGKYTIYYHGDNDVVIPCVVTVIAKTDNE